MEVESTVKCPYTTSSCPVLLSLLEHQQRREAMEEHHARSADALEASARSVSAALDAAIETADEVADALGAVASSRTRTLPSISSLTGTSPQDPRSSASLKSRRHSMPESSSSPALFDYCSAGDIEGCDSTDCSSSISQMIRQSASPTGRTTLTLKEDGEMDSLHETYTNQGQVQVQVSASASPSFTYASRPYATTTLDPPFPTEMDRDGSGEQGASPTTMFDIQTSPRTGTAPSTVTFDGQRAMREMEEMGHGLSELGSGGSLGDHQHHDGREDVEGGVVVVGTCTAFISKVWHMVEHPEYGRYIHWDTSGTAFVMAQTNEIFANTVLPRFFRHKNVASLVRQLNLYGFTRLSTIELLDIVDCTEGSTSSASSNHSQSHSQSQSLNNLQWSGFRHPEFLRGRPDLLKNIRPKVNRSRSSKRKVDDRDDGSGEAVHSGTRERDKVTGRLISSGAGRPKPKSRRGQTT